MTLIAVSAASFGAMPIFARAAYDGGTDVTALLFLRFTIAAACMVALVRLRRQPWPQGRVLAGLVALGGVGYVGQSLCYFTALTMASASLVALLLYAYPAIVVVLSALLLGTRLTPARAGALGLAVVGAGLTVGPALSGRPLGVALGLGAALIYSVYILAGSRMAGSGGPLASSAVVISAAAVVYAAVVAVQRPAFPSTAGAWIAVVAIALVSTVVAISTFFAGMDHLGAADASTLSTLEPVVTVVLAWALLGEGLTALQVVGGALVLAAVLVLARAPATLDRAGRPR
ncbi:MAG TPA: DMT family transporter [Acidimicrobiales bacterium]|nr:DMT family transporter [Acidimicrobiales bacterium]